MRDILVTVSAAWSVYTLALIMNPSTLGYGIFTGNASTSSTCTLFHQSLDCLGKIPSQCYDTYWYVQRYWAFGPGVPVLASPYVNKSWKIINRYRLFQALLSTWGYLLVTYNRIQVKVLNTLLHLTQADMMFALVSQHCLVCSIFLCLWHIPQHSSLQLEHN